MTDPSPAGAVCPSCSAPAPGRFCHKCGQPMDKPSASRAAAPSPAGASSARWIAATIAVVAILAWFAGKAIKPADPVTGMPQQMPQGAAPLGGGQGPVRGPDISALSPQERVDRLYNRVMLLAEQGKTDSVLFFAPMAIDAYRMLGALDATRKSQLDRIVQTADAAAAKALQTQSPLRP